MHARGFVDTERNTEVTNMFAVCRNMLTFHFMDFDV
jgi:hypothetical protein